MPGFTEYREKSFIATNDLTGKQYYLVGFDASNVNQVVLANAQTVPAIGIVKNEGVAKKSVNIVMPQEGTYKVILGGTVSIGSWLTADANGKAVATTTVKDVVIGKAVQAGVAGDIIEVMLCYGTLSI